MYLCDVPKYIKLITRSQNSDQYIAIATMGNE